MKSEMDKYSKLEDIKHEDFRAEKDYMKEKSIDSIRRQFRMRMQLVATFKDNFRNRYRTLPREEGLNLAFMEDMVLYFRKVLEGRERKQEEERVRVRREMEEERREREEQRRGVKRRRGD